MDETLKYIRKRKISVVFESICSGINLAMFLFSMVLLEAASEMCLCPIWEKSWLNYHQQNMHGNNKLHPPLYINAI